MRKRCVPRSVFIGNMGVREGSEGIEIIGGTCPPDILEKWQQVLALWKYGLTPVREVKEKINKRKQKAE